MHSVNGLALRTMISWLAITLPTTTARAAWPSDPAINVPVCTAPGDQYSMRIISDDAGNTIMVWADDRAENPAFAYDIYAQKISRLGVAHWPSNGVAICTEATHQDFPAVLSDGAGGAIIAWVDERVPTSVSIYAQRVDASGVPQWTPDGVGVGTVSGGNSAPSIVSDGTGGAIVTWGDAGSIFAQRLDAGGAPQWTANGVELGGEALSVPSAVSDGAGGMIVAWKDWRRFMPNSPGFIDVYVSRITAAGSPDWGAGGILIGSYPTNGAGLDVALAKSDAPVIASDGTGGAVIAWSDWTQSSTPVNIYTERVSHSGALLWGGTVLCNAIGLQKLPQVVPDGTVGGAIVSWEDSRNGNNDIYVQRITSGGVVQWAANGVPICVVIGSQSNAMIAPDMAGGAIVAWEDYRGASADIYAQRVDAGGAVQWATGGVPVSVAAANQLSPALATTSAGDAVACWVDLRNGSTLDIYAQAVSSASCLGFAAPSLLSVRDVPNDQGRQVKLSWTASCADALPPRSIESYWVWRSAPPNNVGLELHQGAHLMRSGESVIPDGRKVFLALALGGATYYWEFVTSQPAGRLENYSYVATTTSDSVSDSNPYTVFMIQALSADGSEWWFSNADSGYSVDNLAPATPAPFTGAYLAGAARLHWNPNTEPDFASYRLYRGGSSEFMPAPANLIASPPDTGYADVSTAGFYYKLSAMDAHGNESGFALLTPSNTATVSDLGGADGLAFAAPQPNPSAGRVELSFTLPEPGWVNLAVYDAAGRRVQLLATGVHTAGEHTLTWDGRDRMGRVVAGGLYLLRLEAAGGALTRRLVRVE